MAAIISDGPTAWARDVIDRKLGRAVAAAAGAAMLVAVFVIHPGPARFALAVASGVLFVTATRPRPTPEVTVQDLAEIELAQMQLREWGQARSLHTAQRLDLITSMVCDLNNQLR